MSNSMSALKSESIRQLRRLAEREKQLVREVWSKIEKDYPTYSTKAFKNLFTLYPSFRRFFLDGFSVDSEDPFESSRFTKYMLQVLLPTLGGVIHHLDHAEAVHESMKRLGVQHRRQEMGLRRENIDTLGQVLLNTLKENVKDYTEDQENALTKVILIVLDMFSNGLEGKTG